MAKTQLFARLRGLVQRELAARSPRPAGELARAGTVARRAFMERTLVALGALAASLEAGCGEETDDPAASNPRIAIIGGGMAGLLCAYRLEQAGLAPVVYEAADRVGGRMHSLRTGFAEQVAELGGEFIDSGHMTLRMLAKELDIALDDRTEPIGEETRTDVWWVEGRAVPEATIVEQFTKVAPTMYELMLAADDEEDDTAFVMLDNTSMADWFAENLADLPELRSVLENAYRGEYGREIEEQSILNLIYLIGSDDPEPFRIFGVSDERFHTHEGSQTFVDELAARLVNAPELGHRLVKVEGAKDGYRLTFKVGEDTRRVTADYVVFALPFTLLRLVDLDDLTLSTDKRTAIAELGYGTNAKVMGAFARRVWLEDHDALGSVTSDEPFQQCWDTSIGQAGEGGLITNFLGGKQGERSGDGSAEQWYTGVLVPGLEEVFPGCAEAYVGGSAVRMHWPTQPFARGSYACYLPGQWAFWGTEGLPEGDGTLLFCGEHTSLEFQGYMEGAAETGALAAGALLEQLGMEPSAQHAALLALKRSVPQPAFGQRVSFRARKARWRSLARAMAELVERDP